MDFRRNFSLRTTNLGAQILPFGARLRPALPMSHKFTFFACFQTSLSGIFDGVKNKGQRPIPQAVLCVSCGDTPQY